MFQTLELFIFIWKWYLAIAIKVDINIYFPLWKTANRPASFKLRIYLIRHVVSTCLNTYVKLLHYHFQILVMCSWMFEADFLPVLSKLLNTFSVDFVLGFNAHLFCTIWWCDRKCDHFSRNHCTVLQFDCREISRR